MSKIFIDTNIIVYTLDPKNPDKQIRAREIVKKIVNKHQPVISIQVINEFYVVATRKLKVDSEIVKNIIHNFHKMEIIHTDLPLIKSAIDISTLCQLSYWDSLIIAAAEKAHCTHVFSEDLNAWQTYRGVLLLNPFVSEF